MKQSEKEKVREAVRSLCENAGGRTVIIGIDGRCGAGKSTLGEYLHDQLGGNLFHMDDFFLQPGQRTKERLAKPGGNVDYERFQEEVLTPVLCKDTVKYRRYNCKNGCLEAEKCIPPEKLNIIEGAYCMHPYFGKLYDLKIFLDISVEDQIRVIRKRNGEAMLKRFREEWIPMENRYFDSFSVKEQCDITILAVFCG